MKLILCSLISLLPLLAWADSANIRSFDDIWGDVYEKSLKQKSILKDKEASELSLRRASRHWLPRVFVTGQWFSTNDPTQVFFQNLGQRSVKQSDFMPADLNRPGRSDFKTGALGLDFPLYEGGMKSAQTSMYQALVRSSELESKAKRSEEYAELARHYTNLIVLSKNDSQLMLLKKNLEKVISSYQVGSQNNPIGYSGLLGLKGVDNRIKGLLAQFELKKTNARNWISIKAQTDQSWNAEQVVDLKKYLSDKLSHSTVESFSSQLLAQEEKLKTLDEMKEMEKARYLPRVGFFAQNNLYEGHRDSTSSQAYGLYLQWDLFNPDSYGRVSEADTKALAEKMKLASYKQEEKIIRSQLKDSKETLEINLEILEDSDKLLMEQSLNAMKLFRSGMLNALQLAEVVNRRVDLVENKLEAETQYIDAWTKIYQLNN